MAYPVNKLSCNSIWNYVTNVLNTQLAIFKLQICCFIPTYKRLTKKDLESEHSEERLLTENYAKIHKITVYAQ